MSTPSAEEFITPATPNPKIMLIVPAYNEEKTIARIAQSGLRLLKEGAISGFLVINDGSTDDTAAVAKECGANVLEIAQKQGKGNAFLQGALYCARNKADILITIDADLSGELGKKHIDEMIRGLSEKINGNDVKMSIYPCIEKGHISDSGLVSGQRAIKMRALNFMFSKAGEETEFSCSGPAQRFFEMVRGYGLERALNYQIQGWKLLSLDRGLWLEFERAYRTGRESAQLSEAKNARALIEDRSSKAAILRSLHREKVFRAQRKQVMRKATNPALICINTPLMR
ncbi:Glycosyl transferase family 2 [Candidatus Anstonella stagnisolia]|nr:Glycosyl transferase family 2 [Candidatus Anstonella stagnisolia]